ncbi:MAG: hypothetical protein QOH21_84 [Acidobacteriota bacterium]|nr:hypothetical protein [Acidobacteriota bacterium]
MDSVDGVPVRRQADTLSLLLYTLVAAALLVLVHRRVLPLSRGAALVLFAIPFAFVGKALLTGGVYGPIDHPYATVPLSWMKEAYGIGDAHNGALSDVYMQMIPWRKAVQWSLTHGEWPLWNPFTFSGDVLAASAQPAPYHPLTLLACLLPVAQSFTFTTAMTHLIAALGAFLLARELGCREGSAFVAAIGFTYATSLALFALWPLGASWAWLPWVLLGAHRASLPLLTTAFTLLLLAGHPESVLHVVAIGAVSWLVLVRKRMPAVVGAGLLALGLAAIQLLPMLEAIPQTMEHAHRQETFAQLDVGVPLRDVAARLATDAFPYLHLRNWNVAGLKLVPYDSAAVGSIVLALAIYAAWRARSRASAFFAALAVFGLLARAGWRPLAGALHHLPLFDITLNERFSFAAAFALAILAALGVEELLRRQRDRGAVVTLAVVLAVIAGGNVWLLRSAIIEHVPLAWGHGTVIAEIVGLALVTVLIAWRPKLWVPALVSLLLVQRFVAEGGIVRTFPARAAYPPIPILQALRDVREPFRMTGHGNALIPGTSTMYGLEDVRGYQAMTFLRYRETYPLWSIHQPVWYNRVDDLTRPFLSFLNVRYAITWDRDPPPPGWIEVARQKGSILLENRNVLARAFVPATVRLSAPNALEEMAHETDFGARAWIESGGQPADAANGPGRVLHIEEGPREYALDADMQAAGWIVTSIPAWKGWRAYIDGKRVETQIANHAFVSVHVEAGRHRVRLSYWPRGFVIGRGITAATLLALIAWSVARWITGSRPAASRTS